MNDDEELEWLFDLNGCSFEGEGYIVEFKVERTDVTRERPHGISCALVLRSPDGGDPWLRFDNAHAVKRQGGQYVKRNPSHDHWHRDEKDPGRPYPFTTAEQLMEDFWSNVDRILKSRGLR